MPSRPVPVNTFPHRIRSAPSRTFRPRGQIPPTPPASRHDRRRRLKASYHRLGRLAGQHVAQLIAADAAELFRLAASVRPVRRRGDARRIAATIVRLRSAVIPTH